MAKIKFQSQGGSRTALTRGELGAVILSEMKEQELVVLLHGLSRTRFSMRKLEKALSQAGFRTINNSYPSTKYPIEALAEIAIGKVLATCGQATKIHFVTHSLGGILVRQYLHEQTVANLGRVVMLGPPNQGSQLADKLHRVPGYHLLNGPAGMQLGTDVQSVPNQLGSVNFDVGVIAGTRSMNLLLSTMLPSPDDGKVSVASTKLDGMVDHIALPVTHPLMVWRGVVIKQVLYFLRNGRFQHK